MQHYGGRELAASFRTVRQNTLTIAEEIAEHDYAFTPTKTTRSVGQLLTHIAFGPAIQLHIHERRVTSLTDVNFMALMHTAAAEEAKGRTKAEIIALLKAEGERFAHFLESLTDAFLSETVAMMPGGTPATKSRLEMLLSPKEHEMHHRGQLMLIERMLGMTPHLTRQMQARMAQRAEQAAAGSGHQSAQGGGSHGQGNR